jgi:hypothetical protein
MSVFIQNGAFMEYHSSSANQRTYIKAAHIPFKSSLLTFARVLQIV